VLLPIAALGFVGYLLIYAGAADGGVFAKQPWRGLYEDAYSVSSSSAGGGGSEPLWKRILGGIADLPNPINPLGGLTKFLGKL